MSSSLSKKELYAFTLAKLKELAREYDIPGRSTYNASNKNELADKIHSARKKRAKAAAAGPIPVVPVVIDPPAGGELGCNMPQKTCETSSKYKKNDIMDLAKRCGVTNLSGTRKELCARIAAKMAAGVVPEPVPLPSPEPVPLPVGPGCYGRKTYEELIEMKVDELRELMNKAEIMKNRPSKKQDMAAYLCAVQQNGRCDPEKGVDCNGNLVCDVQAKVCLDRDLAARRNQEIVEINGKTIVGTPAAITQLRKKLEVVPAPQPPAPQPVVGRDEPQTPEKPPTPDEPPPGPVVPPVAVPVPVPIEKPVHGAEVVDIEEVLRRIQAGGDVGDISALSETQKAVFKCLGLIG